MEAYKRGGIVKKKKARKPRKKVIKPKILRQRSDVGKYHQSQRQNVVVNVNHPPRQRRRAGGGRKKKSESGAAPVAGETGHLSVPMSENYKLYEAANDEMRALRSVPQVEEVLDDQRGQYLQLLGQQRDENEQRQKELSNLIHQGGQEIMKRIQSASAPLSAPLKAIEALKKKRGRPVGSKNKKPAEAVPVAVPVESFSEPAALSPLKTREQREKEAVKGQTTMDAYLKGGGGAAAAAPEEKAEKKSPAKKGPKRKVVVVDEYGNEKYLGTK